jgi:hypothetical protein
MAGAVFSACGRNSSGRESGNAAGMKPGQYFPLLALPSLESGELSSVRAFRGTKTLLHVFASW